MNLKYPTVQNKLIAAGVRNLKEFGYPDCNTENILADPIYSAFFKEMLKDNRGIGIDAQIQDLLEQLPHE